jgi:hypothetical protein
MPAAVRPDVTVTAAEATWAAVRAQGFGAGGAPGPVLNRLGAVQLDTISVLARSHELVQYARLGAVPRAEVERAYWGARPATALEYSAHAACLLPVTHYPYLAFRRREKRARGDAGRWAGPVLDRVRELLREGPIGTGDLGGGGNGGGWYRWSEAKSTVEWLYGRGDVVCVDRRNWQRVYDLPERALPADVLGAEPTDAQCHDHLVRAAVRALGVATRKDIADYYWLRLRAVDEALARSGLVPVAVTGWPDVAWAEPSTLRAGLGAVRHEPVLLSPFDSLIWTRDRMRRLFGLVVLLEAYRPKEQRVHGYYVMPVLAGGRVVGRVDPARDGTTLVARQLSLEDPDRVPELAAALRSAAGWVGCDAVAIDRAPRDLAARLRRLL